MPAGRNVALPGLRPSAVARPPCAGRHGAACRVCGNRELYKKKDFPHWLGMTILAVACLASLVLNWPVPPVAGLGASCSARPCSTACSTSGSATSSSAIAAAAHYRGFPANPAHQPFELGIGERYRQEKLRREQVTGGEEARVTMGYAGL